MTFERMNRVGHNGGPLWCMKLTAANGWRSERQLIIEPRASQNPSIGSELLVWFEEQRPQYQWITNSIEKRPSGAPTYAVVDVEVPNSRRTERCKHALEYIVIKALSCADLHGDSAASAVHSLFWLHFVEDDDGLTYLCKYSPKESGNFYASQRLMDYVRYNGPDRTYAVTSAIEDAMKHNPGLGERFSQRAGVDRNLREAIEALLLTGEAEEIQHDNVRKIVKLNATRMDHVIAAIVEATRGDYPLLGLRACQRIERDVEFFTACDAFVLAHPDGDGMPKFLRPHCKPVKPIKPTQGQEDDCYE
jgi:hypothetical protein